MSPVGDYSLPSLAGLNAFQPGGRFSTVSADIMFGLWSATRLVCQSSCDCAGPPPYLCDRVYRVSGLHGVGLGGQVNIYLISHGSCTRNAACGGESRSQRARQPVLRYVRCAAWFPCIGLYKQAGAVCWRRGEIDFFDQPGDLAAGPAIPAGPGNKERPLSISRAGPSARLHSTTRQFVPLRGRHGGHGHQRVPQQRAPP